MLSMSAAAAYGALGGLIIAVLEVWQDLRTWQLARHQAAREKKPRPAFDGFTDPVDLLVAVTRAALGCVAGLLLRSEVSGIYAALIVGASAPALLATLGRAMTIADVFRAEGASDTGAPVSLGLGGASDPQREGGT